METAIVEAISHELSKKADPARAEFGPRLCPREPGDRKELFIGCSVPHIRSVAKKYTHIPFEDITRLLHSEVHELRLCALILANTHVDSALKKQDVDTIETILHWYVAHSHLVDHWDLVDESSHRIFGRCVIFLETNGDTQAISAYNSLAGLQYKKEYDGYNAHTSIWMNRIGIISMFAFLRNGNISIPVEECSLHIRNHHHYIQKAVGWILREVGKRDREILDSFLTAHMEHIGSICLSYALEKHIPEEKNHFRKLRKELVG